MRRALPRVTVGIPVYQGERHVLEAIASVRGEEFTEWEILIFDDCSTDSSVRLITEVQDPRIRIISSHRNLGLVNARNQILQKARGEFVAWLDQDDVTYSNRLSTQVAFLDANPNISLVAAWTDVQVDSMDGTVKTFTQVRPSTHELIKASMIFTNPIACNTVMMRKEDFQKRGLRFRERFGNTLDYDLWSRASDVLDFHAIPEPLGAYRMHPEQTSQGLELERMRIQALQVQIDLLARNLGLTMSQKESDLHFRLTAIPVGTLDCSTLESAAVWFAKLREANNSTFHLDRETFDLIIAEQWIRIVNATEGLSLTDKLLHGKRGIREMGIAWRQVLTSLRRGFIQRSARL